MKNIYKNNMVHVKLEIDSRMTNVIDYFLNISRRYVKKLKGETSSYWCTSEKCMSFVDDQVLLAQDEEDLSYMIRKFQ